jgi:hypothetical protein
MTCTLEIGPPDTDLGLENPKLALLFQAAQYNCNPMFIKDTGWNGVHVIKCQGDLEDLIRWVKATLGDWTSIFIKDDVMEVEY